jgi:hypothetical protein
MLSTDRTGTLQAANSPPLMAAEQALVIANERFGNLKANGILASKYTGPEINIDHVATALAFLAQCRKTKIPACHSFDLRRRIGNVSLGAVIAAAVGLDFAVHTWRGTVDYVPHAMMNVNPSDVRRMADCDRDDDQRTGRPATGNLSRTR